MNGKALILKALNHEEVPRTPWVPYTGAQIANLKGYAADEMFQDVDKLVACLLEAEAQYAPDGLPVMFDLQVEAEILGCDLKWYPNTPPTVSSHPLADEFTIPTRRLTREDGRIPIIMEATRRLKEMKPDIALYGLVCGPFTLASHLRGTNIFMDMYTAPDQVKALITYCEEVVSEYSEFLVEAGCDVIGAVDPLVSQISPASFEQFLSEPFAAYFKKLRDQNIPSTFFVCGDATKNIPAMCATRPDAIAIDENVDIVEAKKVTDEHGVLISGNLQLTITMLFGSQQDNQKAAIDLMDALGTKDFILAPGCDVPFNVPPENIVGIGMAVNNKEAVRKALETYVKKEDLPDIELPDYQSLDHVLIEVVTIDAQTCAACGYMLASAQDGSASFGDKVKVVERSIMYPENVSFMGKVGLENAPAMLINGEVKHVSLIPTRETLEAEIKAALG
ncbi:uroporphyrinogen decarboxylase family protein [Desulfoluna butyratoxydans]|uniref:Uroporphyrinogen decarboxylase (Uro-d) n=1 Tax=Desulfoluna butyratoxydans TaxID=231438 RepID=A0A4U8YSQ1_9BACT|nr:uroporphyrinogen decarboxylase family protein [Desulfoluna butyratoxydans]VFQ46804.1 uroporphyrinogen decarboxylase (uro-d) [Desulfoluna butyratoxydans]